MFAFTLVEYNYFETLVLTFIIPARHSHFFEDNILKNAPVCRIAISLNTVSAFTGSCTRNPLWYQNFDDRQNAKLR